MILHSARAYCGAVDEVEAFILDKDLDVNAIVERIKDASELL